MSKVQSIHFEKTYWTATTSKRKLSDLGYTPLKRAHITPNFYEYRILEPNQFKRFITVKKRNGIQLIIGYFK